MLAVVNQPRIRIEAQVIPRNLLSFLEKSYGKVTVIIDEKNKEEKAIPFTETRLYKETRAKMTPGENLMLLRKNRGLTRKALAEKSGFTVSYIDDMECKRIPIEKKSAQKLAKVLGTSISNLFWQQ
ncbi:MAG: helix-turn-helix domain-containing protein [Fibromonadaceae bacterium]|jgi:DNA-binding XRE family transcriptional regulator|nr:helix-turn-helix domain-containing protein [Fibromonadaceae bacterium]